MVLFPDKFFSTGRCQPTIAKYENSVKKPEKQAESEVGLAHDEVADFAKSPCASPTSSRADFFLEKKKAVCYIASVASKKTSQ